MWAHNSRDFFSKSGFAGGYAALGLLDVTTVVRPSALLSQGGFYGIICIMKTLLKSLVVACVLAFAGVGCSNDPGTIASSRIGVCSWSYRLPLKNVAAEMAKGGITGVHLALGPFVHADGRHGDAEGAETWAFVKENVKSGKWKLMSTMIGTVGEDYTTLETIKKTGGIIPDEHWAANQKILTQGAKLTQELGCRYMSLHAGFIDEHDPAAYKKCVERVKWMRDEAKKYGVELILESGQETAADLAKFLNDVPGVYINFDPANMILYAKGKPREALKTLLPWIRQVHIKDACLTKTPGTWGTEVPWGDGEVGGKAFIADLEALGYKGNYVIEREGGQARVNDINLAKERLEK